MVKNYGWKPDIPDQRDFKYSVLQVGILPTKVDLSPHCPPVYDQGKLGSCTGCAIAGAIQFEQIKKSPKKKTYNPSRLFIYYNERLLEGSVNEDSGAMIRDGMKVVNSYGVCHETTWKYDVNKFKKKPSNTAYRLAATHTSKIYSRVNQDLNSLKTCLANGDPFVFGFSVYESFETEEVALTGIMPMATYDEALLGGHAVLCVGYDDTTRRFLVRNSWGTEWGMAGYFTMPYAYMTNNNLVDDIWVIKDVNG